MRPLYIERIREQTDFWTATSPNLTQWHWHFRHFSHFTFLVSASAEKAFAPRQSAFMPRLDNKFYHDIEALKCISRLYQNSHSFCKESRDFSRFDLVSWVSCQTYFHMKDIIRHSPCWLQSRPPDPPEDAERSAKLPGSRQFLRWLVSEVCQKTPRNHSA